MQFEDDEILYEKPMLAEMTIAPWIIRGASPEEYDEYEVEQPTGEKTENDDPLA